MEVIQETVTFSVPPSIARAPGQVWREWSSEEVYSVSDDLTVCNGAYEQTYGLWNTNPCKNRKQFPELVKIVSLRNKVSKGDLSNVYFKIYLWISERNFYIWCSLNCKTARYRIPWAWWE